MLKRRRAKRNDPFKIDPGIHKLNQIRQRLERAHEALIDAIATGASLYDLDMCRTEYDDAKKVYISKPRPKFPPWIPDGDAMHFEIMKSPRATSSPSPPPDNGNVLQTLMNEVDDAQNILEDDAATNEIMRGSVNDDYGFDDDMYMPSNDDCMEPADEDEQSVVLHSETTETMSHEKSALGSRSFSHGDTGHRGPRMSPKFSRQKCQQLEVPVSPVSWRHGRKAREERTE